MMMTVLSQAITIDSGSVVTGSSIIAGVYAIIQIGDRLWRNRKSRPDEKDRCVQSRECEEDHRRLHELIASSVRTNEKIADVITKASAAMHYHEKTCKERHEELLRMRGHR